VRPKIGQNNPNFGHCQPGNATGSIQIPKPHWKTQFGIIQTHFRGRLTHVKNEGQFLSAFRVLIPRGGRLAGSLLRLDFLCSSP
jgi:hypothetical protein